MHEARIAHDGQLNRGADYYYSVIGLLHCKNKVKDAKW